MSASGLLIEVPRWTVDIRRYLRSAGLAPTGLHVLRHSAAKLRRDAGQPIEAISAFLDHTSLAVTTL
jgi:integrase